MLRAVLLRPPLSPSQLRRAAAVLALLLTLSLDGCASLSSIQSADTLGAGKLQVAVEPGVWGGTSSDTGALVLPHVDASVRFGLSERVDAELRAGSSFLRLGVKGLLSAPGDPTMAVSLAPSIGGLVWLRRDASTQVAQLSGLMDVVLPLLVGLKFGRGDELVLGPRLQGTLHLGDARTFGLVAGVTVGYLWRVGENIGLMPELALAMPLTGASPMLVQASGSSSGLLFQFKVGVLFGDFPRRSAPPIE